MVLEASSTAPWYGSIYGTLPWYSRPRVHAHARSAALLHAAAAMLFVAALALLSRALNHEQ
mgnify:CR=1 FL=1